MATRPERIRIRHTGPRLEELEPARAALAQGELVIFPTETVYGLGVRADLPDGAERLNRAKGRPPGQPVSLHLARASALEEHTPPTPLLARLRRRFLPGPLTLLVPPRRGGAGWIGLRVPRDPLFPLLAAAVGNALLATSANVTGSPPPVSPEEIPPAILRAARVLVDAGPTRHRAPSTIVRLEGDRPVVVREGAVPAPLVADEAGPVTLIVCVGNTCRSPMAAALLEALLRERVAGPRARKGYPLPTVLSAGLAAVEGSPATPEAQAVVAERGLSLAAHRARRVQPDDLAAADLILAMTPSAAEELARLAPAAAARVEVLAAEEGGIPDPFGGDLEVYRRTAERIQRALEAFLARHEARFRLEAGPERSG